MLLDQPTQAAIIGGAATMISVFGALLGVYLNLAWNRKQHRDEKAYNLRRDVYLDAIGVISRAVGFLVGKAVPKDKEKEASDKTDVSRELSGACAKVHVLGSNRVVSAIIAFESSFENWGRKFAAHQTLYEESDKRQQEDIDEVGRLAKIVGPFIEQRDQAIQLIKEFKPGSSDPSARTKAQDAVIALKEIEVKRTDIQKQLDSLAAAVTKTATERYQELANSLPYILEVQKDLQPLVNEITIAMKSDLGLRTDERQYKDKMQIAAEESLRSTKEFMENHPTVKELKAKLRTPPLEDARTDCKPEEVPS